MSLACAALGAWLRVDYALFHHHLRHRASSDALQYLERALELLQHGAVPSLPATIWPPGTSALWALLSAMDPSQQLSAAWNAAASILVMPLTAAIAGLLAGRRAGWIALAIAALHPGFIHYAGFALAEQPFQLAIAIAMYLTLSALVRLESDPEPVRIVARAPAAVAASAPAVRAVREAPEAPAAEPAPAGNYIQAEVVAPEEVRGTPRGKLAPPTPGGGSAQGKWFGRFQPKEPGRQGDPAAARRSFIGRERGAPTAAVPPAAVSARGEDAARGVGSPAGSKVDADATATAASTGVSEAGSGHASAPTSTAPDASPPERARDGDPVSSPAEPNESSETAAPMARRTSRFALTGTASLWIAGAAIGCSWTLAALLRPNALPVATVGALVLLILSRRTLPARAVSVALGAVLAGAVVLGAAAHRCTATAAGRFCLVSNNVAMNVALGQAGTVYGLEFRDQRHPELATAWVPPSLLEHGYKGLGNVPASVYDAPAVFSWVAGRFADDPIAFVVRSIGNAFDLFNLGYWPDEFGRYSERSAFVLRQAWSAAVFIPALFALFLLARQVFRSARRPAAVFVLGALSGLLLGAALSLGEARYRIPFDGLLVALASAVYARTPEWSAPEFVSADRLGARHFWLWGQGLALSVLAVIGLSHPALNLGLVIPQRAAAIANRGTRDWATAADFAAPRAAASTWNAQGNYVWKCTPDCGELRIRVPGRRLAQHVNLSVDHNDRYRVLFYRDGRLQASADVPPATGIPTGLQATRIAVPAAARSGIDAIGVQPLYGDGGYSLGHLILE